MPRTQSTSPPSAGERCLVITGVDLTGKFCVAVVGTHGVVTRSAPKVRYMQGWTVEKVKGYCTLRGWLCEQEATDGSRADRKR